MQGRTDMTPGVDSPSRTVLIADISTETERAIEASIEAAIMHYRKTYGEPRHVWVNPKDVPESIVRVSAILIERKGGCSRRKIMVM
jgi:hypothetical protein